MDEVETTCITLPIVVGRQETDHFEQIMDRIDDQSNCKEATGNERQGT